MIVVHNGQVFFLCIWMRICSDEWKKRPPFIMLDNESPLSSSIFWGPSARATALAEWVLKTWQILWGCHCPNTTKVLKSQGILHFITFQNCMFPFPEYSSFSLVFIPQEMFLRWTFRKKTLVVKEESLPCSYPWGFTSCGMFTRCCCSMLGHSFTCMWKTSSSMEPGIQFWVQFFFNKKLVSVVVPDWFQVMVNPDQIQRLPAS